MAQVNLADILGGSGGSYRLVREELLSGTTWVRPADVFVIERVILQGAGAAGGSHADGAGGGSAGCGIVLKNYPVTGNITYAIGAPGTGVASSAGNNGGNTTWDGITAPGGIGGGITTNSGGSAQVPSEIAGTAPAGGANGANPGGNGFSVIGPTREYYIGGAGGGGDTSSTNGGKGGDSGSGFKGSPGFGNSGDGYGGGGASMLSDADSLGPGAGSRGSPSGAATTAGIGKIILEYWSAL